MPLPRGGTGESCGFDFALAIATENRNDEINFLFFGHLNRFFYDFSLFSRDVALSGLKIPFSDLNRPGRFDSRTFLPRFGHARGEFRKA